MARAAKPRAQVAVPAPAITVPPGEDEMKTKDWILCILSAILLILSFPKFNLWILAWFAFVPLFFALRNKSKFKAFLLSYFAGIIFWVGTIYWLVHVTFVGLICLVLYLALYFGVFGLIITRQPLPVTRHLPFAIRHSLIFIPSVWVLLEYLRSHLFTGFGWGLLGYSQYLNLPAIQIADIAGVWGVSFLVMMANLFVYSILDSRFWILDKKRRSAFFITAYTLTTLLLSLGYGFYKLHPASSIQHPASIKISVIQGNIPQSLKWLDYAKEQILERYLSLTSEALSDNPDVIIWPEAALPGVLNQDGRLKERLKAFVGEWGVPLLAGAVYSDKSANYNSAILISRNGEIAKRYDKLHLVPFGEYIPVKDIFGFLETVVPIGDFVSGKEYTVFSLAPGGTTQEARRFSVLICFEDIFPQISRGFVKKGADFLVNITNDAWFGDTSSPYQHLQASVFRAVENGVYLVRAANTGISGFIGPYGEVRTLVGEDAGRQTFISGYKTYDIALGRRQNTFYTEWGDWFVLVCLIIAIYGAIKVKGERLKVKGERLKVKGERLKVKG